MRGSKTDSRRRFRISPALVVASIALFAAISGFGYAAVKMKPNSVKTRNLSHAAVTTGKIADGAVTTPKLAPDAVAPSATNAANATNATNAPMRRTPPGSVGPPRASVRPAGSRPRSWLTPRPVGRDAGRNRSRSVRLRQQGR